MEFKTPYVLAMREQAPKLFMQHVRARTIEQHLQEKSEEAHELLRQLLAQAPRNQYGNPSLAAEREAEEIVRATLIEFPEPESEQRPEPPYDIAPMRKSREPITG